MKKVISVIFCMLLLTTAAFAAETQNEPEAPVFSVDSGVYDSEFVLQIYGDGDIYYTTDGSVPTASANVYKGYLNVAGRTKEFKMGGGFRWPREDGKEAQMMPEEVLTLPSGSTIRAAVIKNGVSSPVVSRTYFVGKGVTEAIGSIPIVNIIATPRDLWDNNVGIYTNYNYEHKVGAEVHYINAEGKSGFSRNVEVKVSGHGSRSAPKKSLRIYFDKKDPLHYDLIPGTDKNYRSGEAVTEFSKVTFRISDWSNTNLRDVVAQKIGESTRADTANSTPVALFLNGEYWGMYECREQYDEKYVAAHYDIDKDSIVFLDRDWTLPPSHMTLPETGKSYTDKLEYSSGPIDGESAFGESYYREQWNYVQSLAVEKDISDSKVYSEFCANVDVDNFIDFLAVYIFSANDDWPGNNFKFWRVTEESIDPNKYGADGKWRFMIHDFDIAFEDPGHPTLMLSALFKGGDEDARHPAFATALLGGLLKNETFRSELAQRLMVYMSTSMSKEGIEGIVASLTEQRKAGKTADLARWGFGPANMRMEWWNRGLANYADFAEKRSVELKKQFTEILNGTYNGGISGNAVVKIAYADCDFTVGGVMLGGAHSGKQLTVFAGIPITVKADNAVICLENGENRQTGEGIMTFTPSAGEYTISVSASQTKLPETAANNIGFMREDRFKKMKLGESLPVAVFNSGGERVEAQMTVEGDCVVIENGAVKAVKQGTGTLRGEAGGNVFTAKLVVE